MNGISNLYPAFLRRFYGMHIGANVRISYKAKLDKSINPKGIHIGDNTWVLADSMVFVVVKMVKGKIHNYYRR